MLDHRLVLKANELFLIGNDQGDESGAHAEGLYWRDTRYLSQLKLSLDGVSLDRESIHASSSDRATIILTNAQSVLRDGQPLRARSVTLEQHVVLAEQLRVRFVLRNLTSHPISLRPVLEVATDFRDMFAIRGEITQRHRGRYLPARLPSRTEPGRITLRYNGLDGLRAETVVTVDRPDVDIAARGTTSTGTAVTVSFSATLHPGDSWELNVGVAPRLDTHVPTVANATSERSATVSSNNPSFNRLLERSAADLALLQTDFPHGRLPAAGIPWFVEPFGRDSLITGLRTLHLSPQIAAATLRVLAALQGTTVDPWRAEEPGKILHEVRYGELARLGVIPHTPYYGTVDATPLFVLLFAETVAWTGDDQLYRDLLPHVEKALAWIEGPGDPDGDHLVEYPSQSFDRLILMNHGWKDTHDALHHRDGRLPSGDIALVEVQGYVYAAYSRLADVVAARGDLPWAAALRKRADATRRQVEDRFWLEEEGFYAQALDGDKRAVRAITSNPGHLLFCGLPSPERAAAVAARLMKQDLNSGWGIRTLSSTMPTYDPTSYHNGSVWPHDNSLIAAGLRRYGHAKAANDLAEALFAAGKADPLARLPELYCGFARTPDVASEAPVEYPVRCSPQAWAAGAVPLLVRTMLGLDLDLEQGRLLVAPALPDWLEEVEIVGMEVLGTEMSLSVRRNGGGYRVSTTGPLDSILLHRDEAA